MATRQLYKICLLGAGGVGKSTLLEAKCRHTFNENSELTIGIDFACVPLEREEEDQEFNSSFLAFDLGGQERFRFIHDSYIRGIKGAIIMYDLTRFKSFDNFERWNELILAENPETPIVLVGTKKDLVEDKVVEMFKSYFEERRPNLPNAGSYIDHLFVSSKDFEGIEDVFLKLQHAIAH